MSKEKIGRIAGGDWMRRRASKACAVYNADYTENMSREYQHDKPWTTHGPMGFKTFTTHAEALAWAFEKAEAGK